jgi:hypothetical protein
MELTAGAKRLMMQNNAHNLQPQTGWSQSGNLVCQNVAPLPNSPPGGRVVKMQVCFPKCDVYTIQFDISHQDQPVGGIGQLVFADITWIVDGTSIRRSVSVISGTTISGVGEACNVNVYDASPLGSEVGVPGLVYGVTINVSPGLRAAQSQQPFYDIPNPDPTSPYYGQCAFPVPPGELLVYFPQLNTIFNGGVTAPSATGTLKPIGATSIHVTVGNESGDAPIANQEAQVIIQNIGRIYDPRDSPQWQPMPPGAYAAQLVNNSTSTYVFSVTLGIDG